MLSPLIKRPRRGTVNRPRERGVTLALVAVAIFSIIAMAGLSIDVGTLYQASAEAQRAADAGALAAARFISMSGVTGDTNLAVYWQNVCGGSSSPASSIAVTVAQQNVIGGASNSTVTVTYSTGDAAGSYKDDCSQLTDTFAVNPLVKVQVTQAGLPTYFSRIWGRSGNTVSATAMAEVFNPSKSGSHTASGDLVPVQPRCVKPWIVPNLDPGNTASCTTGCPKFVGLTDGSIQTPGIINSGTGVIGEQFILAADCGASPGNCRGGGGPPFFANPPTVSPAGTLQYVPGQVLGSPVAVPSCGTANPYQQAIAGCDQSTPYQCGVPNSNQVDFTENPITAPFDTLTAAECLIHQAKGQDSLDTSSYPYQITAGAGNPLKVSGVITSSNSIVSLPIYDSTNALATTGNEANITIVGFLQVFIKSVETTGNLNVTVLNVAGCGNGQTTTVSSTPVYGTSPVPVRLITPP